MLHNLAVFSLSFYLVLYNWNNFIYTDYTAHTAVNIFFNFMFYFMNTLAFISALLSFACIILRVTNKEAKDLSDPAELFGFLVVTAFKANNKVQKVARFMCNFFILVQSWQTLAEMNLASDIADIIHEFINGAMNLGNCTSILLLIIGIINILTSLYRLLSEFEDLKSSVSSIVDALWNIYLIGKKVKAKVTSSIEGLFDNSFKTNSNGRRMTASLTTAISAVTYAFILPQALAAVIKYIQYIIMLESYSVLLFVFIAFCLAFAVLLVMLSFSSFYDLIKMKREFEFEARVQHYEKRSKKAHMRF